MEKLNFIMIILIIVYILYKEFKDKYFIQLRNDDKEIILWKYLWKEDDLYSAKGVLTISYRWLTFK